jgi:cytochrome o ubiquinol oxidase subunit II
MPDMKKTVKLVLLAVIVLGIIAAVVLFFTNTNVAVLNPKGEIAEKQRDILIFSLLLISIVVVPVFALLGIFAWRYRDSNKHASYRPDWDNNKFLEIIWWGIPFVIILILAVVTWRTSHELDPYKSLASSTKPVKVQVVALQWKWLFIYPDQKVASVNMLHIPEDTPIEFTITADAPMNAFWIPSLGTQVYAMSGMSSKLSLSANEPGDYKGSSSNISGEHFADMAFTARAYTKADFAKWVKASEGSIKVLDQTVYDELAKPDVIKESVEYKLGKPDLYESIVMKYMMPPSDYKDEEKPETTPKHDHGNMMHDMEGM